MGLRVVVRDADSEVIAAYCNVLLIFSSQIEATLVALWSALKLCANIGLNNEIFWKDIQRRWFN